MSIFSTVRKGLRKAPGKRFRFFYHELSHQGFLKIFVILFGLLMLPTGVVLLFIPGPGILFIVIGLACCAIMSYKLAEFLDASEKKIQQHIKKNNTNANRKHSP